MQDFCSQDYFYVQKIASFPPAPTQRDSTEFRLFSIIIDYYLNVGGGIIARSCDIFMQNKHKNGGHLCVAIFIISRFPQMTGFIPESCPHDSLTDVTPWPISGVQSVDGTFSARLSSLGNPFE